MSVAAQWTTAGASTGAPVSLGSTTNPANFGGKVFSLSSQVPPAGVDGVTLTATYDVTWQSNTSAPLNSDIRVYADAMAVTVP
jgi:hypothetical protein